MSTFKFIFTLFLLSLSIASAQTFDVSDPHSYVTAEGFFGNDILIDSNPVNGTYTIFYSRNSGDNDACVINKLNSDWQSTGISAVAYDTGATLESSCSFRQAYYDMNRQDYIWVAGMWRIAINPYVKLGIYKYFPQNQSYVTVNSTSCSANFNGFSVSMAEDGGLFVKEGASDGLRFGYGGTQSCASFYSDSEIDIGVYDTITDWWKVLRCGNKYHIFNYDSGKLLDHLMLPNSNWADPTYLKTIDVSAISGVNLNNYFDVYCDNSTFNPNYGIIYFVTNDIGLTTNVTISKLYYDNVGQSMSLISTTYLNGGDITGYAPFENPLWSFTKNQYGKQYLAWLGTGGGDYGIDMLHDTTECVCGQWTDISCVGSDMNQTRSCYPDMCQQEQRLIANNYCAIELNRTQGIYEQRYRTWSNFTKCYGNVVKQPDVGAMSECEFPSITIPSDCEQGNVTIRVNPIVDYNSLCSDQSAKYVKQVCNPYYDCFTDTSLCGLNVTGTYEKNINISSGQISSGKVNIYYDSSCQCRGWFLNLGLYGVQEYYVEGTRTITCERKCIEENVCMSSMSSAVRHPDCSETNQTYCDYGCVNGQCQSSLEEQQNKSPISLTFFESPTNKFFFWLLAIFFTDLIVFFFMQSSKADSQVTTIMIVVASIVMMFVGTIIGWLPIWIPVMLLVLGIIFMVARKG